MERIGAGFTRRYEQIEKLQRKKNTNSSLIERYQEKPVLFNPGLGRISKSAIAGLFMSQMLYWHQKGRDKEWTYKTRREFELETCLTRSEQDRAIIIWKRLGTLEVKKRGIPQRRFFRINIERLNELLKDDFEKRMTESCK